MTYQEIKNICRKGKVGLVPGIKGYITWNYATDTLQFDGDIRLSDIENREDLYYII